MPGPMKCVEDTIPEVIEPVYTKPAVKTELDNIDNICRFGILVILGIVGTLVGFQVAAYFTVNVKELSALSTSPVVHTIRGSTHYERWRGMVHEPDIEYTTYMMIGSDGKDYIITKEVYDKMEWYKPYVCVVRGFEGSQTVESVVKK